MALPFDEQVKVLEDDDMVAAFQMPEEIRPAEYYPQVT
jgi:hypothetical protein